MKRIFIKSVQKLNRIHKIDDISLIHVDSNRNQYFVQFQNQSYSFQSTSTVLDFQTNILNTRNSSGNENIRFMNYKQEEYSGTVPMYYLIRNDFIIQINDGQLYSIVNGDNIIIRHYDQQREKQIEQSNRFIELLSTSLGSHQSESTIQNKLSFQIIKQINEVTNIDKFKTQVYIKQALIHIKSQIETEKSIYQLNLDLLQSKLQKCKQQLKDIESVAIQKHNRHFRILRNIIILQLGFINYSTFITYSYDIMEPIITVCTITDAILVYSYFLYRNQVFSFENMRSHQIKKQISKREELQIDIEECEGLLEYFTFKKKLLD